MYKLILVIGLILFGGLAAGQNPPSPPIRSETYYVVDEQCRAEQFKECMRNFTFTLASAKVFGEVDCPPEYEQAGAKWKDEDQRNRVSCRIRDGKMPIIRSLLVDEAVFNRASRCAQLAVSPALPAASPQCLRRIDTQRLVDTMEVDMKMLLRQMCEANNGKECEKIYAPPQKP